jgi:putative transposase
MGKRGHTEEEILRVLREAEAGSTAVEVCRKHGISQQSFYLGKRSTWAWFEDSRGFRRIRARLVAISGPPDTEPRSILYAAVWCRTQVSLSGYRRICGHRTVHCGRFPDQYPRPEFP